MHNKTSPPRPRGKHMTIFGHFAEERTFAKSVVHTRAHGTIRSDLQVPGETLEKGIGVSDGAARKPLVGCSGELQGFRKSQI